MNDTTQQETLDTAIEPPGPKRGNKPPKYFDALGKHRKLVEGPAGELTRVFNMRPQQPQF